MSLVVCANAEKDDSNARIDGGLTDAWSFRNTLSSTYKIPADSQVALQSCKLNVDGRVVVSRNNANFYHYFGQKLDLDGSTSPQAEETTSMPVFTSILNDEEENTVLELSKSDVANAIQAGIRRTSFHPNTKELATVEINKNASGLDFLGYKYTFDQSDRSSASKPSTVQDWYGANQPSDGTGLWTYSSNILTRNASSDDGDRCCVIGKEFPMSTEQKEFEVNISSTNANANASGVEWHVGLSRFINFENSITGQFQPHYFEDLYDDPLDITESCFMDFAVARNYDDELVAYHSTYNADEGTTKMTEIEYWDNTNGSFSSLSARKSLTGTNYEKVKITIHGEQVSARIYNGTTKVYETIASYGVGQAKTDMFKPVNQACWCLHPVLCIGRTDSSPSCSLEIANYNGMNIPNYDASKVFQGGWFESMELLGAPVNDCWELETRYWNNMADATAYAQINKNASNGINYDNVLILQESDVYFPSFNANAKNTLGFEKAVIDTPLTTTGNLQIFDSTEVPTTNNLLSMFVRLDNFGQSVVNALTGNNSKIISHLTSVETAVGRRTYEPSSLIYIDLNNPNEMSVSDFNISFCYANEQYATILQGQSIVCLYFRPKPKMLM